jgi:hypothetical protein
MFANVHRVVENVFLVDHEVPVACYPLFQLVRWYPGQIVPIIEAECTSEAKDDLLL